MENKAEEGGGIFCQQAFAVISRCTISRNISNKGGGIYCYLGGSPSIESCRIHENYANYGGGILYEFNSMGTMVNCAIHSNRAVWGGGVAFEDDGNPNMSHCTLYRNRAELCGGAITCVDATPTITNSILWEDYAPFEPEIYVESGSPLIQYSDVQGGWPGTGNIDDDPDFVGWGDFHLLPGSPCIDTGTDAGVYTDIDGDVRPYGAGFDMGTDEFLGAYWVMEMDLAYEEGILSLDFTLGTPEPASWWIFLISTEPEIQVLMLFGLALPVIDPPREEMFSHSLPSMGLIGVLSVFKTDEGIQAHAFEWVDTGVPSP